MVPRWCHDGATMVPRWCHDGATMVPRWCHDGAIWHEPVWWHHPPEGAGPAPLGQHQPDCEGNARRRRPAAGMMNGAAPAPVPESAMRKRRNSPTASPARPAPTCASTPTTPSTGIPWGAEALARARELDRPIFLSIGYSACHWCHVMEHESFEDPEIGKLLNEHFVSIKVDREERPDLDQIYMTAVQLPDRPGRLAHVGLPDARPAARSTAAPISRPTIATAVPGFQPRAAGRRRRLAATAATRSSSRPARSPTSCRHGQRARAGDRATSTRRCCGDAAQIAPAAFDPRARRLRHAPQVPAPDGPAPAAACLAALRRRRRPEHGPPDARPHGAGRHLRPPRRRLPPLQHRRTLAGAALREDALRQRPARASPTSKRTRRPASRSTARSSRRRWTTSCAR